MLFSFSCLINVCAGLRADLMSLALRRHSRRLFPDLTNDERVELYLYGGWCKGKKRATKRYVLRLDLIYMTVHPGILFDIQLRRALSDALNKPAFAFVFRRKNTTNSPSFMHPFLGSS